VLIGQYGHLAFNGPTLAGSRNPLLVKVVTLGPSCLELQVREGCPAQLAGVPSHVLMLTNPATTTARFIFHVVPGSTKAEVPNRTLKAPISTDLPATAPRRHLPPGLFLAAELADLL
jgi:glucosamine-6-phosphate deaminase